MLFLDTSSYRSALYFLLIADFKAILRHVNWLGFFSFLEDYVIKKPILDTFGDDFPDPIEASTLYSELAFIWLFCGHEKAKLTVDGIWYPDPETKLPPYDIFSTDPEVFRSRVRLKTMLSGFELAEAFDRKGWEVTFNRHFLYNIFLSFDPYKELDPKFYAAVEFGIFLLKHMDLPKKERPSRKIYTKLAKKAAKGILERLSQAELLHGRKARQRKTR